MITHFEQKGLTMDSCGAQIWKAVQILTILPLMLHSKFIGVVRFLAVVCVLALSAASGPTARAALANFPFTNSSLSSTDSNTNSSASAISLGSGLTDTTRFVDGNPGMALRIGADETPKIISNSLAQGSFFSFTIAPGTNYRLNLTTLSYDLKVTAGNTDVRLQYSLDGGSTFMGVGTNSNFTSMTYASQSFDVSGLTSNTAIQNGGAVTFRFLVAEGGVTNADYAGFDNILLNGNLVAIPEPGRVASWMALSAIATGSVFLRCRKA